MRYSMTKEEAMEKLKDGEKLTHKLFYDDEYIYLKDDVIIDESGIVFPKFWEYRTSQSWMTGWGLYDK